MKAQIIASGLLFMQPCERPPIQYQGESVPARVIFADPRAIDIVCRGAAGIPHSLGTVLACTNAGNSTILLPDPCLYEDAYAKLVCHERAHLRRADGSNGWSHG